MMTERDREILQQRQRGETCEQIATDYGVSGSRISQICRREERRMRAAGSSKPERKKSPSGNAPVLESLAPAGTFRIGVYCRIGLHPQAPIKPEAEVRAWWERRALQEEGWSVCGFYLDHGGDDSERNRLIRDCYAGNIDLIFTCNLFSFGGTGGMEISWRIADELKRLPRPVGIFFYGDGLYTLSEKSIAEWQLFMDMLED